MELTEGLVASGVVALIVAGFARHRGWGIALPVLGVGILFGFAPFGPSAPNDATELFMVILAPLVFGEALSSSYLDIRRVRRAVLTLAIGLVVVTAVAVGYVASLIIPGVPLAICLALGAVLAPTDAVAVATVAKRAGLPRRIVTILEGESLVNDGTGLTLLRVALAAAAAGSVTVGEVSLVLVVSVLGGLAVGAGVGLLIVWVIRRARDPLVANSLIIIAPFPVYFGAEAIEGSGILGVVTTALIVTHTMSTATGFRGRPQSLAAWRLITFVLQAFAFFLVGLELPDTIARIPSTRMGTLVVLVLAVLATLMVSRLVFVLLMNAVASRRRPQEERLGVGGAVVVGWAGARGPVSGLAAFTIPVSMTGGQLTPDRNLILAATFTVIVVTLLLSPTLGWVARIMKVPPDTGTESDQRIETALAARALDRLDDLVGDAALEGHPLPDDVVRDMRGEYEARLQSAASDAEPSREAELRRRIKLELILAQQEELIRLRDEEGVPDSAVRPLLHALDLRAAAVRSRPH